VRRLVLSAITRLRQRHREIIRNVNRLGFLILAITLASGQREAPQGSQQGDCGTQAIVVNARDKQGQFPPSLQASDFRVSFAGKDVHITSLRQGAGTPRIIILVDKSGSMSSESKRNAERFIGRELIHFLPETTQIALVAFGSRVLETFEFGHSRAEILVAIDRLTSSPGEGGTALRDALMHSSDLFGRAQIGDSVVVLSNGQDGRSKASSATVQQAFWSKGVRMFLFELIGHVNYENYQTPEEMSAEQDSEALSVGTGGAFHRIERTEVLGRATPELLGATHDVEDELSSYYIVEVGLAQSGGKAIPLQLELMDSSGRRRRDIGLSFPQKHLPCALLTQPNY
jgi:Mg-chelatase subunit ChlD